MTGVKKNPYCPLRRSVALWDECPMMRLFPGRLHYRCSVCKQNHLVSAHKVDEARASQASKGAYRQE
jgi:hypothetical protein